MTKNFFSFLTGVLLTILLFSLSPIFVKNHQEFLFSEGFYKVIQEIDQIVSPYKEMSDISKTQEALLKTYVNTYEDPYTSYISKEESVMFDTMIQGDFE